MECTPITYQVQTRKRGQAYRTRLTTTNAPQADLIYSGYNIGVGYAKRLLQDGKTVKRFSWIITPTR